MLRAIGSAILWPFRLIGKTVEHVGHMAVGLIGFALMVVGVGVVAASYYLVGLAILSVGLVLMVRSLG